MKKLIGVFFTFALLFALTGGAKAEPLSVTWMLGGTVANGVSYYYIDLNEKPDLRGLFGAQVVGKPKVLVSGTTSTLEYALTNEKPTSQQLSGVSPMPALNWQTIWSGLNVVSGNSQYVVNWYPTQASGMVLRHTSGVTTMYYTISVEGR